MCVLTSAEPRLRTTAVDKAVWHTLIIVWFGGLRLFLSASLHWNALKLHSHVGSRVLSRRNGHENFHSPTPWSADSGMLTLQDGAMSPKYGCQNYCTLCWRWLLVGCKKFLLFFLLLKMVWGNSMDVEIQDVWIISCPVCSYDPWEERGWETGDGGISLTRTVGPLPSGINSHDRRGAAAPPRTKAHSVFAGVVPRRVSPWKNQSLLKGRWKIISL